MMREERKRRRKDYSFDHLLTMNICGYTCKPVCLAESFVTQEQS